MQTSVALTVLHVLTCHFGQIILNISLLVGLKKNYYYYYNTIHNKTLFPNNFTKARFFIK